MLMVNNNINEKKIMVINLSLHHVSMQLSNLSPESSLVRIQSQKDVDVSRSIRAELYINSSDKIRHALLFKYKEWEINNAEHIEQSLT